MRYYATLSVFSRQGQYTYLSECPHVEIHYLKSNSSCGITLR